MAHLNEVLIGGVLAETANVQVGAAELLAGSASRGCGRGGGRGRGAKASGAGPARRIGRGTRRRVSRRRRCRHPSARRSTAARHGCTRELQK